MRANKHPRSACPGCLARPLLLPRSSTVVRDWKQSRAAKVPLSPSVGRFPLSFSWEEKHPEGLTDTKKEEWRLSATRREGHISSVAIITKFFFSISTCRLFKLRLSFHRFPLSDEPAPVIACSNVRYLEWLSAARRADANGRGVGEVSWRSLGLWSEVECTTEFVDRMR